MEVKTMKATTKKLIAATFVLVVAVALAASSTYAWFAMSNQTEVREFDVQVTAGENLLIAVSTVGDDMPDLGSFKAYIAESEIAGTTGVGRYYVLGTGSNPDTTDESIEKLGLATADDSLAFSDPYGGLLEDEGAYFAFDLHFISNSKLNIKLNTGTEITSSGTSTAPVYVWGDVASQTFGQVELGAVDSAIVAYAKNAVRIAFIDESDDFNVYEPNAQVDDSYGNYGGEDNLAIEYYNYINGSNSISAPMDTNDEYTAPFDTFTTLGTGSESLLTLAQEGGTGNFYGKFTVKIWLEGWDADAFDSIKSQTISTVLKFIGVEAPVTP